MKKAVMLLWIIFLAGFMTVHAQDDKPLTFQDFIAGKAAFEDNCIECHSLEWPLRKIATREEWEGILDKMATKGAVLDKVRRLQVLEYLLAKSVFQTKCSVCHELERPLEKNKELQEWVTTVRRMAAKKPGHLTEEEIQAVSGFLNAKGGEKKLY